uniref:Uncharacterized protein n=1 Tax=Arundo donax TaxID=35708 RepID=A0A0A9F8X1_ARUDO
MAQVRSPPNSLVRSKN